LIDSLELKSSKEEEIIKRIDDFAIQFHTDKKQRDQIDYNQVEEEEIKMNIEYNVADDSDYSDSAKSIGVEDSSVIGKFPETTNTNNNQLGNELNEEARREMLKGNSKYENFKTYITKSKNFERARNCWPELEKELDQWSSDKDIAVQYVAAGLVMCLLNYSTEKSVAVEERVTKKLEALLPEGNIEHSKETSFDSLIQLIFKFYNHFGGKYHRFIYMTVWVGLLLSNSNKDSLKTKEQIEVALKNNIEEEYIKNFSSKRRFHQWIAKTH